jgi:hypothetical protein
VSSVVRSLRDAIDRHAAGMPAVPGVLRHLSEGQATTEGALRKVWR